MKRITLAITIVLSSLALTACGNSTGDRALSGGGIGAGVGVGLLLGAPVEGALLGGAIGAGAGALTNSNQVDLQQADLEIRKEPAGEAASSRPWLASIVRPGFPGVIGLVSLLGMLPAVAESLATTDLTVFQFEQEAQRHCQAGLRRLGDWLARHLQCERGALVRANEQWCLRLSQGRGKGRLSREQGAALAAACTGQGQASVVDRCEFRLNALIYRSCLLAATPKNPAPPPILDL
jgi:hypothetical protein